MGGRGSSGSGGGRGSSGGQVSTEYGELTKEYSTGTKVYTGGNVPIPADEVPMQLRVGEGVIKSNAAEQLGVRRSDLDLDTETGLLTVWTDGTRARKQFYQVEPIANTVYVGADGRKQFYDISYRFKYRGSKM